jgi:hypothetical protein
VQFSAIPTRILGDLIENTNGAYDYRGSRQPIGDKPKDIVLLDQAWLNQDAGEAWKRSVYIGCGGSEGYQWTLISLKTPRNGC